MSVSKENKLILIFSSLNEGSTDHVIDWLNYLGIKYKRINKGEFLSFLEKFSSYEAACSSVHSIWVRRFGKEFTSEELVKSDSKTIELDKVVTQLDGEINTLRDFFVDSFDGFVLGNYLLTGVNKLLILEKAKNFRLNVPKYKIISLKSELLTFLKSQKKIISKALFEAIVTQQPDIGKLISYTEEVTLEKTKLLPERFFPSLVQKKIEKDYEIRSFYLCGQFYSMAIFSQLDQQTSVDFRRYNRSIPNRVVPYLLDEKLKAKLTKLMKSLNLNTGSIDLIKCTDGKIYFLEINPIGQYGMVSGPCNYFLNKKIAKKLINEKR